MLLSVSFTYLWDRRTANCVALAILNTYRLLNDTRNCRGNACVCICTPLQAFVHGTDANSELQRYTAELHDRAPLQAQSAIQFWLDRKSSYKRLPQLELDLVASPASQAYVERLFSLCVDLTARNGTELGCPCIGGYFRNWTVTFCIELNIGHICELECNLFWYCRRTAEDTWQRLRFWLLLTSLVISRTVVPH